MNIILRIIFFNSFIWLSFFATSLVAAQECMPWPEQSEIPAEWQNPHTSEKDLVLSLESGIGFAFSEVPIDSTSLYGDVTYQMGSSKERLFETQLDVRISSPISGSDGRRVLYLGKYEISKAQYVYVMGKGDPFAGIEHLLGVTGDDRVISNLSSVLNSDDACFHKLSRLSKQLLSEPITYLSYVDYIDFVNNLNELCIGTAECAENLRGLAKNREVAAFFRLPSEHEWEYAARRGASYSNGIINEAQLQQDLPHFPHDGSLVDHAHLDGGPSRLAAIGSKEPLDGIYDILGNAQEIMQNAFTSETGYGAVGGYVARGGHYKMRASTLRVSYRAELLPFRVDDDTGKIERQKFPYSGLRIALSMPVVGSTDRLGSEQLHDEFINEYTSFESANDRGGNTFAEAEHLGSLRGSDIKVSDEFNRTDRQDYFSIDLATFGALRLEFSGSDGPWKISLFDRSGTLLTDTDASGQTRIVTDNLLPDRYTIKVETDGQSGDDHRYSLLLNRTPAPDTGFATANSALFDDPDTILLPHGTERQKKSRSGYVGKGDFADVFPIMNNGGTDAIRIMLQDTKAPLILRILNEDQRVVSEALLSESEGLLAPMAKGSRGFVQIVAPEDGRGSTYSLLARTAVLVPSKFYTSATLAKKGVDISENRHYRGIIGGNHLEWHFRFKLEDFSKATIAVTDLTADVQIRVRDFRDNVVANTYGISSEGSETFEADLDPGLYVVRLSLKKRTNVTPFMVEFSTDKPKRPKILTMAEAKRHAESLSKGVAAQLRYTKHSQVSGVKYIDFTTRRKSAKYSFAIERFTARSDLNLYLEDTTGTIIAQSENTGSEREVVEASLPPGKKYYLRIEAVGVDPVSSFTLRILKSRGLASQRHDYGSIVSTHKDWEVREDTVEGRCYAVVEPETYQPEHGEWPGGEIPIFYIGYERSSDRIWISVFTKGGFESEYVKASVLSGSGWRRVPEFLYEQERLKPLTSKSTVSNDALRAFTRGNKLRIETKLEGEVYDFTYSLAGYTAANRAANKHCGAKASWTIK